LVTFLVTFFVSFLTPFFVSFLGSFFVIFSRHINTQNGAAATTALVARREPDRWGRGAFSSEGSDDFVRGPFWGPRFKIDSVSSERMRRAYNKARSAPQSEIKLTYCCNFVTNRTQYED
jgi:hypothetical protein